MKRHLNWRQFELLHNAIGIVAAELADTKDSLYHGNSAMHMHRCNQAKFGYPVSL